MFERVSLQPSAASQRPALQLEVVGVIHHSVALQRGLAIC